jgi:hypothetical protein
MNDSQIKIGRKEKLAELNDYRKWRFRQIYKELSFIFFLGLNIPHKLGKEGDELIENIIWEVAYHQAKKRASSFGGIEIINKGGEHFIRWISNNEGISLEGKPGRKIEDLENTIEMALSINENAIKNFFNKWLSEHNINNITEELKQDLYAAYSDSTHEYGLESTDNVFSKHPIWEKEGFKNFQNKVI